MCANKTTKKTKLTRRDAATPSKKQKPAKAIELSSDSDSDASSVADVQQQEQSPQAATPATKRKAHDDEAGDQEPPSSSASKRQRKLVVRVKGVKGGGDEADGGRVVRKTHLEISAPVEAASKSGGEKPEKASTHLKFSDDDDDEEDDEDEHGGDGDKFFTPMERPASKVLFGTTGTTAEDEDSEDESGSDDDAPPEAVSSHAAAHRLNDLDKQAAKAAELQAASERLKRQRRDALFKTQAKKRALDDVDSAAGKKAASAPALLPAEFLESDDESDDEEAKPEEVRKPKKIKFETAERQAGRQEGRGAADRREGDTVFKVVRAMADTRLAPRASKRTAFDKKQLLSRGRVEVRKKGGFLLK